MKNVLFSFLFILMLHFVLIYCTKIIQSTLKFGANVKNCENVAYLFKVTQYLPNIPEIWFDSNGSHIHF